MFREVHAQNVNVSCFSWDNTSIVRQSMTEWDNHHSDSWYPRSWKLWYWFGSPTYCHAHHTDRNKMFLWHFACTLLVISLTTLLYRMVLSQIQDQYQIRSGWKPLGIHLGQWMIYYRMWNSLVFGQFDLNKSNYTQDDLLDVAATNP